MKDRHENCFVGKKKIDSLLKENEVLSNEIAYLNFQERLLTNHFNNLQKILKKSIRPAITFRLWQFYCRLRRLLKHAVKNPIYLKKYFQLIKKKGLSKFLMEIRSIDPHSQQYLDLNANYQAWLKKQPLTQPTIIDKIFTRLTTKKIVFSLVIKAKNLQVKSIKKIIESIINQSYKDWEVVVVANTTNLKKLSDLKSNSVLKNKIKLFKDEISSNYFLDSLKGNFIGLIEKKIYLQPNILFETYKLIKKKPWTKLIYYDEDRINRKMQRLDPFFKPDWSPDYLQSLNYFGEFSLSESELFARIWKKTKNISYHNFHLKETGYLEKNYNCHPLSRFCPIQHLAKIGFSQLSQYKIIYHRVEYPIINQPLVSIIIPTKNQYYFIDKCLNSIIKKTTYKNYELIIVDTGSTDEIVFKMYDDIKNQYDKIKVLTWQGMFNFSTVSNYGVSQSSGDYLLFLNNDIEIITPNWIQAMLEHAQRENIGAVGGKLLYPNKTIQHAGVILGIKDGVIKKGVAGHVFKRFDDDKLKKYRYLYDVTKNYSAVTAACMMIAKKKYYLVGGFDENFRIAFNDIDLCLKLLKKKLFNLYTPYAKLYHYESVSVGKPEFGERDVLEFRREIDLMFKKWGNLLNHDPFYNSNYSLFRANFSL